LITGWEDKFGSAANPAFSGREEAETRHRSILSEERDASHERDDRRGGYTSPLFGGSMLRAILTDSHFWVPVGVLLLGIFLVIHLV
jgi:hypothetical protein